MALFHVSDQELSPEDVLTPGRWGQLIRNFGPGGPLPNQLQVLLWEMAIEAARIAIDPRLPSRLNCIFLCETLEHATTFRDQYRPNNRIFEVAPVGEVAALHRGDFYLISTERPIAPYVDYIPAPAVEYWTREPERLPEIVYPAEVLVIAAV
ncbi:MAG TPA: hypothetical protein VGX71_05905 [Pseudaminobacter sp.]|nr:hypothetical protein [Pseudaminobacter sp.]